MGSWRRDPQAQWVVQEECNHLQSPEATIATRVITELSSGPETQHPSTKPFYPSLTFQLNTQEMFLSFFIMFMFTVEVIISMNVQGTNINKQHDFYRQPNAMG